MPLVEDVENAEGVLSVWTTESVAVHDAECALVEAIRSHPGERLISNWLGDRSTGAAADALLAAVDGAAVTHWRTCGPLGSADRSSRGLPEHAPGEAPSEGTGT